jgi:hypothetical protein
MTLWSLLLKLTRRREDTAAHQRARAETRRAWAEALRQARHTAGRA